MATFAMLVPVVIAAIVGSPDARRLDARRFKPSLAELTMVCKDTKSEKRELKTVWETDDTWRKCLSCNGNKTWKKVSKRKTCSRSDCDSIVGSDGTQLCHRADEFAFNAGVWDRDGNGDSLQFKFMFKPTCVPCVLVPAPEDVSEQQVPDEMISIDEEPVVKVEDPVTIIDEQPADVGTKGDATNTSSKCRDHIATRTQEIMPRMDVYFDDCKLSDDDLSSDSNGTLSLSAEGLGSLCKEDCRYHPDFAAEPPDSSDLIEQCTDDESKAALHMILLHETLENARNSCTLDEERTPSASETVVDVCKNINSEDRDLKTVWDTEPDTWRMCLSCNGKKNWKKVSKRKTCSRSDCNSIAADGKQLCHRVDEFAFNAGVWDRDAQGDSLQFKFHFKPTCVPCIQ